MLCAVPAQGNGVVLGTISQLELHGVSDTSAAVPRRALWGAWSQVDVVLFWEAPCHLALGWDRRWRVSSGTKPELKKCVQGTQGLQGGSLYKREPVGLMAMSRAQLELVRGRQSPMRLKRYQVGGWGRIALLVGDRGCSASGEAVGWLGERS